MKTVVVVNLTAHDIKVWVNGHYLTFPKSGNVARVKTGHTLERSVQVQEGDHTVKIPVTSVTFGEVEGLPKPKHGIVYLVSSVVRMQPSVKSRPDVFSPNTAPNFVYRDEEGNIQAVKALVTK